MICPHCGGQVAFHEVACPYCGQENPDGIFFQNEVRQKIEHNLLLRPFLMKQKRPELLRRVFTRIVWILIPVNILMLFFVFWFSISYEKQAKKDSFSEVYLAEINQYDDRSFEYFYKFAMELADDLEYGRPISNTVDSTMIMNLCDALEDTEGEAIQEDFHQFGVAYLRGYLGLSDEATTYLERNEEGLFVSSAYHQEAIELGKEAIAKLAEQEETP